MNLRYVMFSLMLGLAVPLTAQNTAEFLTTLQESTSILAKGNGVVVSGWDYRATVDPQGMTFTPALGSAAATTQTLSLAPRRFGRAGSMHKVGVTAPHISGKVVGQQRGAGVAERYEVTPAGLELSWRFDRRPSGSGDLVVHYDIDSTMTAVQRPDGTVSFLLAGIGGVAIGKVTGIDASGIEAEGSLVLDGSSLELRLPGAFVTNATYPLVLDPLIGTEFLATTNATWDDSNSDIAYDASSDVYLVAYRRVFSAVSQAIRAQRLDGSGTLIGSFLVLQGAEYANNPTVANINQRDTFVVAWERSFGIFATTDIACCAIAAATGSVTVETLVASGSGDELDPDAAGDNSTSAGANTDGALITYTVSGAGIRVARVTCSAVGAQPTLVTTTTVSSDATAQYPAISKSNPGSGSYAIVWRQNGALFLTVSLYAQACNRLGSLQGSVLQVTTGSLLTAVPGRADVDGDGTDFVVLYEVGESSAGPVGSNGEKDIWARGIRRTGTGFVASSTVTQISTMSGIDEKDPAIAFCQYKYVALYSKQFLTGTNNYDVRGVELGPDCSTCGPSSLLTGLNGTLLRNVEHMPSICSEYGGGADSDEALLVFTESDDSPPFTSSLVAHRYEAIDGATVNFLGSSCGTTADIGVASPFVVGNTDFGVTVSGLPSPSLPLLNFAVAGNVLPPGICGTCTLVNPIVTLFVPAVGTTATYEWPLGCSTYPFLGIQFDTQWSIISPGNSFCGLLPDFTWTRRMRITLGL